MYFATTEFDGDDNAKLFPGLLHFSFLLLNVQAHLCVMREKESVFVCGLYSFIQFAGSKQSFASSKRLLFWQSWNNGESKSTTLVDTLPARVLSLTARLAPQLVRLNLRFLCALFILWHVYCAHFLAHHSHLFFSG